MTCGEKNPSMVKKWYRDRRRERGAWGAWSVGAFRLRRGYGGQGGVGAELAGKCLRLATKDIGGERQFAATRGRGRRGRERGGGAARVRLRQGYGATSPPAQ